MRRRVTARRGLGHRLEADRLQVARNLVVELARRPRLVVQHLEQQHLSVAAERPLPGQQLVEDDPQAVDVGPAVGLVRFAARLLGRHVGRRAQELAVHGHRRFVGVVLGQAEVHQVRPTLRVELDVGRLDVAVNDPMPVGVVQRIGHGGDQLRRRPEAEPAGLEAGGQRLALDELLDEIEQALFGLTRFKQGDQAGVLELGRAACLSQEPVHFRAACEVARPEHFDGNGAAQFGVARPEDLAERAEP